MESRCPELPLLQVFTDFLCSADKNYVWSGERDPGQSLEAYFDSGCWEKVLELEERSEVKYERRRPIDEMVTLDLVSAEGRP